MNEKEALTLWIEGWSSRCGNCKRGADPDEKTHMKVLSYSDEESKKPGCGVEWKYKSSLSFRDEDIRLRPDLAPLYSL